MDATHVQKGSNGKIMLEGQACTQGSLYFSFLENELSSNISVEMLSTMID